MKLSLNLPNCVKTEISCGPITDGWMRVPRLDKTKLNLTVLQTCARVRTIMVCDCGAVPN